MTEQNNANQINAQNSDISAEGNVVFVGGNQYKIGGNVFNVEIAAPSYGTSIEQLQSSLQSNRESLKDNLTEFEKCVRQGFELNDGRIQALIKDIITESKNIELLISAIKQIDAKKAKSQPLESNILVRINTSIAKGQQQAKQNRLNNLKNQLNKAYRELSKAREFKLLRSESEKQQEVSAAQSKIDRLKLEIERLKAFLEAIKNL